MPFAKLIARLRAAIIAATAVFTGSTLASAQPIDERALYAPPAISSVSISPNGEHIAAVTASGFNAAPEVSVWSVSNMGAEPRRFRPNDVRVFSVTWLNDESLAVFGQQTFDFRGSAGAVRTMRTKFYIVDREGRNFREPMTRGGIARFAGERIAQAVTQPTLLSRVPGRPDTWLVTLSTDSAEDVYALNVRTLESELVLRGTERDIGFFADQDGEIRLRTQVDFEGNDVLFRVLARLKGQDAWEEHFTIRASDRINFAPLQFSNNPNILYVQSDRGREFNAIYEYNLETRQLSDPIFEAQNFDVTGVIVGSSDGAQGERGELLGFDIAGPYPQQYWVDPQRQALVEGLKSSLPDASARDMFVYLGSASRDGRYRIATVSGPREPGAYYLVSEGRVTPLGRETPGISPSQFAPTRFVRYAARDGLQIPAYVTTPTSGRAPYPTIVMPHGGPWVRDYEGTPYDRWAQTLAARGYLVLQPQYRGTQGFGQTLWRAGDREWGQKMQDDKDDGVRWLIQEGLADPNRVAMYGFSYGGYAAMAAAVRPNGLYQCAIAGAGLAELRTFRRLTYENRFWRAAQNATVAGLSPIDHASEVSIPTLIFHGNRDTTVPIEQSERFYQALVAAGKPARYLEVDDMPHGDQWPSMSAAMWPAIFSYLETECGPGGL